MKKSFLHLVTFILILCLLVSMATALAYEAVNITSHPRSSSFKENATATWSVEAEGANLSYTWYIVYEQVAYNTQRSFAENHPWQDGVVGDGYGCNAAGNTFFINGIGRKLDGAQIYCVVSDGLQSVTSDKATISVNVEVSPPQIKVPDSVKVQKDEVLKLSCKATAEDGDSIKSYLWYETKTGKMNDIFAIGAKEGYEEDGPILVCDTTEVGTRYYVCAVETENGGFAYSSIIPVTVAKKQQPADKPSDTSGKDNNKEPSGGSSGQGDSSKPIKNELPDNNASAENKPIKNEKTDNAANDALKADAASGNASAKDEKTESVSGSNPEKSEKKVKSEAKDDQQPKKTGLSTLAVVLIAVGSVAVVACAVIAVMAIKKNSGSGKK